MAWAKYKKNANAIKMHLAFELNRNNPQTGRFYVRGLVSLLGGRLKKYWRIGIHWLIAVKNYLLETFNDNIVQNLAAYP